METTHLYISEPPNPELHKRRVMTWTAQAGMSGGYSPQQALQDRASPDFKNLFCHCRLEWPATAGSCLGCQALLLGVTAMPLPVKTETTKIPMCDCLLTSPTSPSKHRLLTKLLLQLLRTCTCSNNVFTVMGQCPNLNSSNKIMQQEAHVDCACSRSRLMFALN